jgi:hypothetical protein
MRNQSHSAFLPFFEPLKAFGEQILALKKKDPSADVSAPEAEIAIVEGKA